MNKINSTPLIKKLVSKQRKMQLSDRQFAKLLSISHSLWTKDRLGFKPIGIALLSGAYNAFGKEVEKEILLFLRSNHEPS